MATTVPNPKRDEPEPEPPGRCQKCKSHVSEQYGRVFGDNQHAVFACLECATRREIKKGAASDPNFELREVSRSRKQRGDTPRAIWPARRTASPEGI